MSEWRVPVVRVGPVEKHPNAYRLDVTRVFGYPVVTAAGEFREGDLAVYVPVDSVVPADDPRWAFLQGHVRIKARKLRGIFSMGLLAKAADGMREGDLVQDALRIVKHEPPEPLATGGEAERCPFDFPKYADVEALRRWPDALRPGEPVLVTEKIHGTSFRAAFGEGRLWVGSHREVKKRTPESAYWKAALRHDLEARLAGRPGLALYGEVYGWVQDLRYGHRPGHVSLALFDMLDLGTRTWLDADAFLAMAADLGLPAVPVLHRGPWEPGLVALAEGPTALVREPQVREGIVVRPLLERFDERLGRVILKYHGEGYLLR